MTNITHIAGKAYNAFETAERNSTEPAEPATFVRVKEDAPEWITEAVKAAHMASGTLYLPCDWIYNVAREAFDFISESDDDASDAQAEFSDNVEIHSSELTGWLEDYPGARGAVQSAQDEGLLSEPGNIDKALMAGQYVARAEIFAVILYAVRQRAEDE